MQDEGDSAGDRDEDEVGAAVTREVRAARAAVLLKKYILVLFDTDDTDMRASGVVS